jgi:hypothetical protein
MVAEKAVMPSAARRIKRIIVSFIQSLAGKLLARIGSDFCPACNCSSKKYLPRHVQFDTSVLNVPTIHPGSVSRRVFSSLDGGEPKARLD